MLNPFKKKPTSQTCEHEFKEVGWYLHTTVYDNDPNWPYKTKLYGVYACPKCQAKKQLVLEDNIHANEKDWQGYIKVISEKYPDKYKEEYEVNALLNQILLCGEPFPPNCETVELEVK